MGDQKQKNMTPAPESPSMRNFDDLPPAAQRALKESQERHEKLTAEQADKPIEIGGRGGKDPARFGDWEVKGIASDF